MYVVIEVIIVILSPSVLGRVHWLQLHDGKVRLDSRWCTDCQSHPDPRWCLRLTLRHDIHKLPGNLEVLKIYLDQAQAIGVGGTDILSVGQTYVVLISTSSR